jgi:hypothetical protein
MTYNLKNKHIIILIALLVVGAGLLTSQVWYRPIDRDEGFWLAGATLINGGKLIYVDFAMPHLPTAPYIYAGLVHLIGNSLVGLRLVNLFISLIGGYLLYYIWASRGERNSGLFSLLLYTFSFLVINWHIPVKVYALLDIFLILGFLFLSDASEKGGWWRGLLAGLFLGLGVFCRSVYLPLLLLGGGYLLWKRRYAALCAGAAGVALAGLPVVFFAIFHWEYLYFNAVGIHLLSQSGYISFWERFIALREALTQPDTIVLLALAIVTIIFILRRRGGQPAGLAGMFFVSVFCLNLAPISSSLQYQVSIVPFAAVLAGWGLARLWSGRWRWAVGILLGIYVLGGLARPVARVVFDRYHQPEVGVAEVIQVRDYLAERIKTGDVIVTYWDGYIPNGAEPQADMNLAVFTERVEKLMPAEDVVRFHLADRERVEEIIKGGEGDWVVLGVDAPADLQPQELGPYCLEKEIAAVRIYSRCEEVE